jgi:hypothetical protein
MFLAFGSLTKNTELSIWAKIRFGGRKLLEGQPVRGWDQLVRGGE